MADREPTVAQAMFPELARASKEHEAEQQREEALQRGAVIRAQLYRGINQRADERLREANK